jgi:hypothetical protein
LIPSVPGSTPTESSEGVDGVLNATTICEESLFPWGRSDPLSARPGEVGAALKTLPGADFYPFDETLALGAGTVPGCLDWPDAAPPPPVVNALPNVPTLILSGAQDLRTPTTNAHAVAAMIPDAQLLVVPYTGHSVLGTDFSGCAETAIKTFFGGGAVSGCAGSHNIFTPTPITPTRLASVRPASGLGGTRGRTLTAVLDTIVDLNRQVIGATLQANQALPNGASFGGLRGGYARLGHSILRLNRFAFVPGVQLSGTIPVKEGHLQSATLLIGGGAGARGTVHIGAGKRVTGNLGGRRFNVALAGVKLSRASAPDREWPSAPMTFPLPGPIETR